MENKKQLMDDTELANTIMGILKTDVPIPTNEVKIRVKRLWSGKVYQRN